MIEQPNFVYDENGAQIRLYQHQLKSVYDLEMFEQSEVTSSSVTVKWNGNELERTTRSKVGLFRDMPGYGKTLSLCVMMARDVRDDNLHWDLSEPFKRVTYDQLSDVILTTNIEYVEKCDCSVVICSPNLIHQWKIELARCGLIYYEVNNNLAVSSLPSIAYLNENIHVVLVSTRFAGTYFSRFGCYAYRRIIYDEIADSRVVGVGNCQIIANFYWLVSATINDRVLHASAFSSLLPRYYSRYDTISVRNDPAFITSSITLPKPRSIIHYYRPNALSVLGNVLEPHVVHLIRVGNVSEALLHLKALGEETLFDVIVRRCDEKLERARAMSPGNYRTMRIADATREKESILARISSLSEKECNICYTIPEETIVSPCCYQVFCSECFLNALKSSMQCTYAHEIRCCMCRASVKPTQLIRIKSSAEGQAAPPEPSRLKTQVNTLVDLLKQINTAQNRKVLVFSEYNSLYEAVSSQMSEHDSSYVMKILRGSQSQREKIIDNFRHGTSNNVLYLNSVVNASGINLPEATDIILCHEMPPGMKNQIVGRAVRIGCTHEVCVHELVCI